MRTDQGCAPEPTPPTPKPPLPIPLPSPCATGFILSPDGECVPEPCAEGFVRTDAGDCQPPATPEPKPLPPPTLPPPQPTCPPGESFTAMGTCAPTTPQEPSGGPRPSPCPPFMSLNFFGNCVPQEQVCPPGTYWLASAPGELLPGRCVACTGDDLLYFPGLTPCELGGGLPGQLPGAPGSDCFTSPCGVTHV